MLAELALLTAALTLLWYYKTWLPPDYPPTPPIRLPLIGHMHYLVPYILWSVSHRGLESLHLKYGKNGVLCLHFGPFKMVLVGKHKDLRSVFKLEETNSRCEDVSLKRYVYDLRGCLDKGIVNNTGRNWHEQHKFMMTALREFGFGKGSMEEMINAEVEEFRVFLAGEIDKTGGLVQVQNMFNIAVLNIIWVMVAGKRHSYDDPQMKEIMTMVTDVTASLGPKPSIGFIFPGLRDIFPSVDYMKDKCDKVKIIKTFLQNAVDEHRREFNEHNVRDFIDAYLKEIQETTDEASSFYKSEGYEQLVHTLIDLFVAGSETVSSTLAYALLFMVREQEAQDRARREIHDTIGSDKQPTLDDRQRLPFTEATAMEIQRMANVLPGGLPHAVKDGCSVPLGPYSVPPRHFILGDFAHLLMGDAWSEGHKFDPTRFIGEDGKVMRNDNFIPFSVGKRICPGEGLARAEIFLFLARLLQTFRFEPEDKGNLPPVTVKKGLTALPLPFNIKITKCN